MINKIMKKSLDKIEISQDEREIYEYGYTLLLEMIVNCLIAIIIAYAMNKISILILFSIFFIPLRSFAGGFHAKSSLSCYVISNSVLVFAYFGDNLLRNKSFDLFMLVVLLLFLGLIIYKISPVDSINKRLTVEEKIKYKRMVKRIVFLEMIAQFVLLNERIYIVYIIFFIQILSLIVAREKDK